MNGTSEVRENRVAVPSALHSCLTSLRLFASHYAPAARPKGLRKSDEGTDRGPVGRGAGEGEMSE